MRSAHRAVSNRGPQRGCAPSRLLEPLAPDSIPSRAAAPRAGRGCGDLSLNGGVAAIPASLSADSGGLPPLPRRGGRGRRQACRRGIRTVQARTLACSRTGALPQPPHGLHPGGSPRTICTGGFRCLRAAETRAFQACKRNSHEKCGRERALKYGLAVEKATICGSVCQISALVQHNFLSAQIVANFLKARE